MLAAQRSERLSGQSVSCCSIDYWFVIISLWVWCMLIRVDEMRALCDLWSTKPHNIPHSSCEACCRVHHALKSLHAQDYNVHAYSEVSLLYAFRFWSRWKGNRSEEEMSSTGVNIFISFCLWILIPLWSCEVMSWIGKETSVEKIWV